jgi:hypothetical protein
LCLAKLCLETSRPVDVYFFLVFAYKSIYNTTFTPTLPLKMG